MLEGLLKAGPFLAGIAALLALVVSTTATARLRRQEELLREAAEATEPPHRAALDDLHRWVLARILARQVCGWWRFTWPWLAWGVVALSFGITGYSLTQRLAQPEPATPDELLLLATGGDPPTIVTFVFFPLFLVLVFVIYEWSLVERAMIAREFYETGTLRRPQRRSLRSLDDQQQSKQHWLAIVRAYMRAIVPGLAAIDLGFVVGLGFALRKYRGVVIADHPGLNILVTVTILVTALLFVTIGTMAPAIRREVLDSYGRTATHPHRPAITLDEIKRAEERRRP